MAEVFCLQQKLEKGRGVAREVRLSPESRDIARDRKSKAYH
jgi:hypothetical protein